MSYYRGAMGDYYHARRGDFWSKAKKALGKVASVIPSAALLTAGGVGGQQALGTLGTVASSLPGGSIAGTIGGMMSGQVGIGSGVASLLPAVIGAARQVAPVAVGAAGVGALGSAGFEGLQSLKAGVNNLLGPLGSGTRKRRSMNAANVHALRRALRRVDSFRNLAKKSGALPAAKRFPAQRASRACCK